MPSVPVDGVPWHDHGMYAIEVAPPEVRDDRFDKDGNFTEAGLVYHGESVLFDPNQLATEIKEEKKQARKIRRKAKKADDLEGQ